MLNFAQARYLEKLFSTREIAAEFPGFQKPSKAGQDGLTFVLLLLDKVCQYINLTLYQEGCDEINSFMVVFDG